LNVAKVIIYTFCGSIFYAVKSYVKDFVYFFAINARLKIQKI
jgi:hypothetical protein